MAVVICLGVCSVLRVGVTNGSYDGVASGSCVLVVKRDVQMTVVESGFGILHRMAVARSP